MDGVDFKDELDFDYDKPLYPQFVEKKMTFDQYMDFLHYPKVLVNPVRSVVLFENPVLEFLTKSPWWHVLIIYSLDTLRYAVKQDFSDPLTIWSATIGFFGWTVLEYLIHKYMLHPEHFWLSKVGNNQAVFALHAAMHGMHHAFPTDPLRMLEPAFISHVLAHMVIFPYIYVPLFSKPEAVAMGTVFGYMCYDLFHYYLHKGSITNETLK